MQINIETPEGYAEYISNLTTFEIEGILRKLDAEKYPERKALVDQELILRATQREQTNSNTITKHANRLPFWRRFSTAIFDLLMR